jgi:Chaperone of endosialidase
MKLSKHRPSPAMVVAMLGVFLGLGGVGLAANGQSLILGQSNSATAQTGLTANTSSAALAITNGVGSPLKLNAPQGVAPLAVSNGTKVAGLNADRLDGIDSTGLPYWKLGGNGATDPGNNFVGTTDNKALVFKVDGKRALRLEPTTPYPNVIAGDATNSVSPGTYAATIAGGQGNTVGGAYSTVAGGAGNTASGLLSFAAGTNAHATDAGSFVWGDASSDILNSNGSNSVSFGATGGARFVTSYVSNSPSTGVTLAAGGGSWGMISDRATKRNLAAIDRRTLLAKLDRMPISSWSYKAQRPSVRHLGPMAQDFRSAFGLGEDRRHIDTLDSEGVALAAIQGLYRQNQALNQRVAGLQRQNRALGSRLAKLEREVAQLSRRHRKP